MIDWNLIFKVSIKGCLCNLKIVVELEFSCFFLNPRTFVIKLELLDVHRLDTESSVIELSKAAPVLEFPVNKTST